MSVTIDQGRQAIMTKVDALITTYVQAHGALGVQDDNRLIDLSTVNPWLEIEILYINGMPASLGPQTAQRVLGSIILTARVRKGAGIAVANTILEHFYPSMHQSDTAMFPVRTWTAKVAKAKPIGDWVGQSVVIPFWYDN